MTPEINEMSNICRLCARTPEKSYKLTKTDSDGKQLRSLINTYLPIKVTVSDGYPQILCSSCYRKVKRVIRFVQEWLKGQKEIRRLLQKRSFQAVLDPEPSSFVAPLYPLPIADDPIVPGQSEESLVQTEDELAAQVSFDCKFCQIKFSTSNKLRRHIRKDHEEASEADYECSLCDKRFKYPASVAYHKYTQHYVNQKFACGECNLTFKHRLLLQRHQRIHSPKRKFGCDQCSKSFRRKDALKAHSTVHKGETKLTCEICSKQCSSKGSYRKHLKTHESVKAFTCGYCGKNFLQKRNLADHIRVHTGEKPFHCDKCPSQFKTVSQMKAHSKTHSDRKEYKCDFCESSFRYKASLKTHLRSHTGETPFSCTTCLKSFKDRANLRKHERSHSGEKPYECKSCGQKFSDTSNFRKHVKRSNCGPSKHLASVVNPPCEDFLYNDPDFAQIICLTYDSQEVDVNSFVVNQKPSVQITASQMMEVLDVNRSLRFEAQDGSVYELASFPAGPSLPDTPPVADASGVPSDTSLSEIDCLTRIAEASAVDVIPDIDFINDSLLIESSIG